MPVPPIARSSQFPHLVRWSLLLAALFLPAMTLLRAVTYLVSNRDGLPPGSAADAFLLGARFDIRIVACALLPLLILGSVPPLNPFNNRFARRVWLGVLFVFGAGLVAFYTTDFIHHRYLGQRLNASALGFLVDAKISAAMAWQTYPIVWIALGMAAGVAALCAGIVTTHRRVASVSVTSGRLVRTGWSIAAGLLCVIGLYGRVGQYPLRWSDAFNLRSDAAAQLALNPVQSFFSSLSFRASGYDVAQVREHYPRMREYLGVEAAPTGTIAFERRVPGRDRPAGGGDATPPNVVLVICESFSGYKSSMWGNPLDPTPFFASLCRDGVFFDNCFTPHFGTARGIWATVTGIPDVEPTKTASRNPALVDQHTIINDFVGYEKFYFLGGSSSWANIRGLLTNNIHGLQLYEEGSYESPRIDVWGISDKNLFLEANKVLRRQTRPFFAIIQTANNHRPYTIPKEDLGPFQPSAVPEEVLKTAGFESIAEFDAFRYSDFAIQKFIEAARAESYFENTLFVFIGDHGIGGNAGTMFPSSWTAQSLTSYHVPMLFYAPKLLRPERIQSVASMVDLLPTAAGIAGIPYRNTGLGRDLLRQQTLDGGRANVAFIMDHNAKSIGAVFGPYYGSLHKDSGHAELVWADFNATEPAGQNLASAKQSHGALASAFHETARYMLSHNKKAAQLPGAPADGEPIPSPSENPTP